MPNDHQPRLDVLIVGSGFGGICAALALRRLGVERFELLERRDVPGGTWVQNTYPGAQVDVHSPLYSIAGEPWPWTQMFAERDELERYTQHLLDKHDLRARVAVGADACDLRWDDAARAWEIRTTDGGVRRARFVVCASGPLSQPAYPDIPGRDRFEGAAFHTNAWDHGVDLTGKRVAVVGSGASAAQVIPAIASTVGQLHVFQRTPHWVMPRPDHAFSPWQRRVLARPPVYAAVRAGIYWGLESRMIGFKYSPTMLKHVAQRTALHHLERQVPDPELRAKLTPDFTIGCKRIILSNTLYPALARANVTVHAREDAIAEVVADGVKTKSGAAIGLDAIIWATGYDATDGVLPYTVTGRDGATLADRWADYPRAYLGTTVPGFPNLALVLGPNTGIGHTSALFIVESQMLYIARAVREALATPGGAVEPRADAEERYTAWVHEEMKKTVWEWGGCSSWYKGRSGRVIAMFPGFSFSYRRMTRSYRPEDHDVRR